MTLEKLTQHILTPAAFASAAFVVKIVISRRKISLAQFCLDGFSAAACGVIVYNVLEAWPDLSPNVVAACAGMAGMIGPEILGGLLTLGKMFRDNPSGFLLKHISAIRGNKVDDSTIEKLREWERDGE